MGGRKLQIEKLVKEIMQPYLKPVYDYHYDGKVIYPEDAEKMMMELYERLQGDNVTRLQWWKRSKK